MKLNRMDGERERDREMLASQTALEDGIKIGHLNKIGIANINSSRAEQTAPSDAKRSFVVTFIGARKSRADPGEMECGPFNPAPPTPPQKEQKRFGQRRRRRNGPTRPDLRSLL